MSDQMIARANGYCCIVLHTHLPYIHHPDYEDFLEEDWLFEALLETYLPLLYVMRRMKDEGVRFRLSFSLTPPLLEMMRTADLMAKFEIFLSKRLELARRESRRLEDDPNGRPAAEHYVRRYGQMKTLFESIGRDVPSAFRALQDSGDIEILASAATHAFLPLLRDERAVRAQVAHGTALYRELFGREPRGFWLPECAYRPGLEDLLAEFGLRWIVLETNAVNASLPRPFHGTFRPIRLGGRLVAFGRDPESSRQVWSSVVGYPGDPTYRELYRDIGYDGDYKYVRPFLKPDGIRRNLGIKYHRITGNVALHEKEPWSPSAARERAAIHAGNFLFNRGEQINHWRGVIGEPPCVLAPYDTELFGHWWYEGPWFFESLFRQASRVEEGAAFVFATPSEVLMRPGTITDTWAHHSSWGAGSFYRVWLNEQNHWVWRHLHEIEARLIHRLEHIAKPTATEQRLLEQMGRELLLAQSSDWPFIITMNTSTYYAEQRFRSHVRRFLALDAALSGAPIDDNELVHMERTDAIFRTIDLDAWR